MPAAPALTRRDAGLPGPLVVAIMDGVGIGRGDAGDAVTAAATPNLDRYAAMPLSTRLRAHGRAVGLPSDADMGNSEVGHNALGAGQVIDQGASRVARAIADGTLFRAPAWQAAVRQAQQRGATLHLVGLLSDGGVHSHIDHLLALVDAAAGAGVHRLRVHVLLDGRDVAPISAERYLARLEAALAPHDARPGHSYLIASGGGRSQITMDRYGANWPMVARGWAIHVHGDGPQAQSAAAAVAAARAARPDLGDQDLPGFVVARGGAPVGRIVAGDAVIAFNFRGDRMLELAQAFEDDAFTAFARGPRPAVFFCAMTCYDGDTQRPRHALVPPPTITGTLGELLAAAGAVQVAVSETQKFGHVTYFWNGNRSLPFDPARERWIEVPSLPEPFSAHPEMRADAVTDAACRELAAGGARLIRLNFANGDMVGHSGDLGATVAAVAAVDRCLGRLEAAALAAGGALVVTADHGNAEEMLAAGPDGQMGPKTSHTTNPVPLHLVLPPAAAMRWRLAPPPDAGLGHVAATLTDLLGYVPAAHHLPSLLRRTGR